MKALARVRDGALTVTLGPLTFAVIEGDGDKLWIPIRRACEVMGLSLIRQARKLKSAPWATVAKMAAVAGDGKTREIDCLDVECLPMWLATLGPRQVSDPRLRRPTHNQTISEGSESERSRLGSVTASDAQLRARLLARTTRTASGCLLWTGARSADGYGWISVDGQMIRAHRLSLALAHGVELPPSNVWALHSCGNRACVNPEHLRWGSPSENAHDRVRDGNDRNRRRRGKLPASDVARIRSMLADGVRQSVIADAVGCSRAAVCLINAGVRHG